VRKLSKKVYAMKAGERHTEQGVVAGPADHMAAITKSKSTLRMPVKGGARS